MGARKDYIQEKIHWILGNVMGIISLILVVAVFGGAYFFVIAPSFISKPFLEYPYLPPDSLARIQSGEDVINSSHINYIVNELGAYKLNTPILTKDYPLMEFVVTDTRQMYYSYVDGHNSTTEKGNPKNPDISISASQETIYNALKSEDVLGAIQDEVKGGKIQFNLTTDMTTLARKGYLSLYRAAT